MTSSVIRPAFLARFTCLAAECEDTCCKGWGMQLGNATYERYRKDAPELLDAVVGTPDNYVMKRDPKSDYCVKFEGGLCATQKKYGEDFLGDACHLYPRALRSLGTQTVVTATLSCPEIARLALFGEDAFATSASTTDRLPESLHDYLPGGLSHDAAFAIHQQFIAAALNKNASAEHNLMVIMAAVESLAKIEATQWPQHVEKCLGDAASSLPAPEPHDTDPVYLLQALCGLVAAAKNIRPTRLMQTITDMQSAMRVNIPWDTLAIAAQPDSPHAVRTMHERWKNEWQARFAPVLRQYVAAQLSLALFPFAGFGQTPLQRIAIIGVRLATVKLALMSASTLSPAPLAENEIVRVVQSLSRFLDHLADPEFSIRIYQETGWLQKRRLRALLGDA